jgi:uncharacterized membrane protein YedE/YeeE
LAIIRGPRLWQAAQKTPHIPVCSRSVGRNTTKPATSPGLTSPPHDVQPAGCRGAFLFGLGMQLGGGCASGTLYTAGGGNTRMLVTLVFFIAGSALGAWHLPWWSAQANLAVC